MRKKKIIFLLSACIISNLALGSIVSAKTVQTEESSVKIVQVKENTTVLNEDKYRSTRAAMSPMLEFLAGYIASKAIDGFIANYQDLYRWSQRDPSGYNRWVNAVNAGKNHCYNMCPIHSKFIDPRDYGY
ncbi:hypothetical protein [Clostridium botulinum]|uniref:hypothetical protein n=1 Tax=Clostridium botulinum TaxID=1491 RepID=UPI000773C7A7|nr:hypothetical protein [Clostridium botulinum]